MGPDRASGAGHDPGGLPGGMGVMDPLQRAFYRVRFREAFLELQGKAFEDWFARLAGFALGSDFERVRPYGPEGDRKADGRSRRDRTIYQCYAPEATNQKRLMKKIDRDFAGAVEHWSDWMKRWVFVCNDRRGLPPAVHQRLDALRADHPSIAIDLWGEADLTALAGRMDLAGWESLFGVVPAGSDAGAVAPDDVAEVVRHIQQVEPKAGEESIRPPSVDKIQKNHLSRDVLELLKAGKRKDHLVKAYFETHHHPDFGEKVAEAFRHRYRSLKETERSPDDIFVGLQRFVGGRGSARRQVAALAVLSYLFDRCDIFEDPDGQR